MATYSLIVTGDNIAGGQGWFAINQGYSSGVPSTTYNPAAVNGVKDYWFIDLSGLTAADFGTLYTVYNFDPFNPGPYRTGTFELGTYRRMWFYSGGDWASAFRPDGDWIQPFAVEDELIITLPPGWTLTVNIKGNYPFPGAVDDGYGQYFTLRDENGVMMTNNFWLNTNVESTNICFSRGARFLCDGGETILVEDLQVGHKVMTKDRGAQPVRAVYVSKLNEETLTQFPNRRPILFKAGALGVHPDFRVSPQHRMLIDQTRIGKQSDEKEALVAAKHLVNDSTIVVDHDCTTVEYFHIVFDQHEIVCADGVWSESFYPGPYALREDRALAHEISILFPEIEQNPEAYGPFARPVLRKRDVRVLPGVA